MILRKFKVYLSIGCILLVIGLSVLLYAPISNFLNSKKMADVAENYDKRLEEMYEDTDTEAINREIEQIIAAFPDTDYDIEDYIEDNGITADPEQDKYNWALISLLRQQMEEYNQDLIDNGQYSLNDPFAYEQPSFDLYSYSVKDGVFGHLNIPAINLELPIYLGANAGNMNYGAAHLSLSSMPIGGESTNAVFAAHRGYVGKIFFDNIVFLNLGDDVYITNFWEELHYKVVDTQVISPYEIDKCYIQEGRDLITLLTCHPYGSSEYRYMVVCERVDDGTQAEN